MVEGEHCEVIGSRCVYVVDEAGVTYSNIAEARPERALSMYDIRLHVLCTGDTFDLAQRRPAEVPDVRKSHAIEAQVSAWRRSGASTVPIRLCQDFYAAPAV